MSTIPALKTKRLILRPFTIDDVKKVQLLANDFAIADTTASIPYPYEESNAEEWIKTHEKEFNENKQANFAIIDLNAGNLIGAISLLDIKTDEERAELGYWVGKKFWNNGYCTEAARAIVKYGFETLKLNRIYAHHLTRNSSSGRVMHKIGMKHEGSLRQHFKKWDKFEDVEIYGILRSEF